ncbi:MAG: SGNH/GDSL hydrolase family protein [Acidobacteriales bacterium]|nr:SGNH/GDSL hydrolase family protein [Terriglobales bacterium]
MNMELDRRQLFQLAALSTTKVEERFQTIKGLLAGKDPVTWVFTGDSITHGALHTMGWRSYPEHFAERVRWELGRVRDIVINTGISGDRLPRLLQDAEWRVHRFQPQVVSLMMGMNDCIAGPTGRDVFRKALDTFLADLKAQKSLLLLHTPNPIYLPDMEKDSRKDLPAYVDILRQFASDNAVPLVDHYQHWMETRRNRYELVYLLNDAAVHPNQHGHVEFANYLFRKLGIFDPATSRTCRLFVP